MSECANITVNPSTASLIQLVAIRVEGDGYNDRKIEYVAWWSQIGVNEVGHASPDQAGTSGARALGRKWFKFGCPPALSFPLPPFPLNLIHQPNPACWRFFCILPPAAAIFAALPRYMLL